MVQVRAIIILLIFQYPFLSYAQEIDSVNHEIESLNLRIDSLQAEIMKLREVTHENQLSKNYFDTIISSQWNMFSTILTVIIGLIAIIFGLPFLKWVFKDLPDLKKTKKTVDKELPEIQQSLENLRFNSNRALYVAHLTRKNFEWCIILAIRCMSFFTKVNDQEAELEWLNNAFNCFKEATEFQQQKFLIRSKEEAVEKLNAILVKEYPEGSQNPEKAKSFLKLINPSI